MKLAEEPQMADEPDPAAPSGPAKKRRRVVRAPAPPRPDIGAGGLMRSATYAAVGVSTTLVFVKTGAWVMTESVALLSSLIDSLLDAAASVVNLVAVRRALQPADHDHRFGHGKAEPLAGLGQSAFIAGSAVLLIVESLSRLIEPQPVRNGAVGIGVMVVSILLTIGLVHYQRYVVKKTASVAIGADSLHYVGDVLINGSVIVSLIASAYFGWSVVDPIFAVGIAAYLLFNAWSIMRESFSMLMDREFPTEDRVRIRNIVMSVDGARNMHDLRTRSSGLISFIQLHVEMDRNLPLWQAHDIADTVEIMIREAFPNAEVIIHQDPDGIVEHHPDFHYTDPTEELAEERHERGE